MSIFDALKSQLIDVIEWLDDSSDTLVYRFYRPENEIMNGARLIVRESQVAAFVNQGQLADVFLPGMHTLATANLPILSRLQGWKYGFQSPFKAEVYFVSTRTFTDRKWGTKNPIMLRDAEFGPVRLRAFGSYAVKVKDPAVFLKEVVGTNSRFSVDEINDQLRDLVTTRFAEVLGASKIPALDLAGNYGQLASLICSKIEPDFAVFGMDLVKLLVENISLPPEVEAAMDKRSSMGVIGNMQAYTQYQTANAIGDAANNPGGIAGAGVGLGAGMAMANQFMQANNAAGNTAPSPQTVGGMPPPLPTSVSFFAAIDGKQSAAMDQTQIADAINQGKLTRATLVWTQGMAKWTPAGEVPALVNLFASVPPPLPPV
jgi:membrane protease subunit (stomatin/prohibitin family)